MLLTLGELAAEYKSNLEEWVGVWLHVIDHTSADVFLQSICD